MKSFGFAGQACRSALFFCLAGSAVFASQTRTWTQEDYADFEKANVKNLSIRSDGLLTLAPEFRERFDSPSAYLWAVAADSKGNVYAGGGPGAKLYRIPPKGEAKSIVELEGLEIHAIAVNRKDQVFAATSPDGKIYRISDSGKSELFYDPKAKYIWALVFDSKGNLYVGTGDRGDIHRVTPDGKGAVFFKTEENHARSLAVDSSDNLIAGTEPGGLVIRISPAGQGFVLHQLAKKEITAVAVGKDGDTYAAGVGNKQAGGGFSPAPIAPLPAPLPAPGGGAGPQARAATPPPTMVPAAGAPVPITGGSEIYRIGRDGAPRKMWAHAQDIVYALGFDREGRLLAGTGNKGYVYRIDSDTLYTALVNAPPTQITAFASGRGDSVFAATGNVGKVFELGPGLAETGTIESDVFDAGAFSEWGRLTYRGSDANVSIVTRSGNLDQPQKNWSPWSAAIASRKGAPVASPAARFLQWKATLAREGNGDSPRLEAVDVAYLSRNIEPRITEIELTPPNYKFPAPSASLGSSPPTLTLPPLGKQQRSSPALSLDTSAATPAMQYAKGSVGARWAAADDNGDALVYKVEIRGLQEREWKLLKDKVREKYLSWDSTAFPDGEYKLRVTASDAPSNPKEMALSANLESYVFLIDNAPPQVSGLAASRNGGRLTVRWKASDALSNIEKAEYSLDGGDWTPVLPVTKLSDSPELTYELNLDGVTAGEHTIAVRVQDEFENQATDKVVTR